jgi:peptidyl-prolyl cis-trans isomerase B (cyclophilin B)
MSRIALVVLTLAFLCGLLAAGAAFAADPAPATDAAAKEAPKAAPAQPATPAQPAAPATTAKPAPKAPVDEVAVMETSKGTIVIEFWDKDAPKTVANFKKLSRQGFYNGTGFHRILKGFMIQGGDPNSKNPASASLGTGGPGYTIPDEFNSRKHVKGVLSMAHTSAPNSGGSQFFVMHGPAGYLDGKYSAFGRVIKGIEVVDAIANTPCEANPSMPGEFSKPKEWTKVVSVKIVARDVAMGGGAAKEAAGATTKAMAPAGSGVDMNKAVEGAQKAAPATPASPETKQPATPATPEKK